jgi:hypothetical protein
MLSYYLCVLDIPNRTEKWNKTGGKQGKWTEAHVKAAASEVRRKMSIREAAEVFSVPKTSFNDRLMNADKGENTREIQEDSF